MKRSASIAEQAQGKFIPVSLSGSMGSLFSKRTAIRQLLLDGIEENRQRMLPLNRQKVLLKHLKGGKAMIKTKTVETMEEFDKDGRLLKRTVTETAEVDDSPVRYTHTSSPCVLPTWLSCGGPYETGNSSGGEVE